MPDWELSTDAGSNWSTFASLSLNSARRSLVAFGLDRFTFRGPAALALTADLPTGFAYASTIIVRYNDGDTNPRWFYGRMGTAPRTATGSEESIQYTLDGPWWYLERCMYQQSWKVESSGSLIDANKARVILCQSAAGARIDSGAQIEDAIDWCIARGAPITKGTIDAGTTLPFDERVNISCAEVIASMLRYTPDVVPWFDYTTSPYPTLHVRKRANLTAVSKAITALAALAPITPRNDLQVPGVTIIYERLNSWDDSTYQTIATDTAGTTDQVDSVFASFELQGSAATFLKQEVEVAAFPTSGPAYNWNDKTWWKSLVPELQKIADADLTIEEGARTGADLANYLVKGQIHEWMDVDAEEQSIAARISGIIRDESDVEVKVLWRVPVTIKLVATDATTKTYSRLSSFDGGEDTPTGVAAALYAAWNTLFYEGTLRIVASEVAGDLAPGRKLNLTGGRAEWATMAAMIVESDEDLDNGITTCRFGPPARIEADSLVALLRALRARRPSYNLEARTTGQAGSENAVELSGYIRYESPSGLEGEMSAALLRRDDPDDNQQTIDLDPSGLTFADAGDKAALTIQPREILIPELSGGAYVLKRRQVLASESYHAAVDMALHVFPFRFSKTSATGGDVEPGTCYIDGVLTTITSLPASLSSVTTTTRYYVEIDFDAGTATWQSTGGAFPDGDTDTDIWPILTLTCADSAISAIKQHQWCDIHARSTGSSGLDPALLHFGYTISGTDCTIAAGNIFPSDGRAAVTVATLAFTLAGTKYVYATWDRVAATGTLYASAALPSSTVNLLVCPLYKCDGAGITEIYHVGDFVLDTPIR